MITPRDTHTAPIWILGAARMYNTIDNTRTLDMACRTDVLFLDTRCRVHGCTSWLGQEKLFFWQPFSQYEYNKRLLRQKTGGACLYMPQDGH